MIVESVLYPTKFRQVICKVQTNFIRFLGELFHDSFENLTLFEGQRIIDNDWKEEGQFPRTLFLVISFFNLFHFSGPPGASPRTSHSVCARPSDCHFPFQHERRSRCRLRIQRNRHSAGL